MAFSRFSFFLFFLSFFFFFDGLESYTNKSFMIFYIYSFFSRNVLRCPDCRSGVMMTELDGKWKQHQVSTSQQDTGLSHGSRKLLSGPIARLRSGLIGTRASADCTPALPAQPGPRHSPTPPADSAGPP